MAAALPAIPLRPHHLLCSLTYIGKGYSPEFVANYDRVVAALSAGAAIEVVEGPDALCAPRLASAAECHCHDARIARRDSLAAADLSSLFDQKIESGSIIARFHDWVPVLRAAFAAGTIRAACLGCMWRTLCDDVAATGFADARLFPDPASIP